jgi:hypothetical protein
MKKIMKSEDKPVDKDVDRVYTLGVGSEKRNHERKGDETMATTETEYVVITETNEYGPKTTHAIHRDADGKQIPSLYSLDEALAAVPDQSGPTYLGHNEASVNTSAWEVVREIDAADWCGWPGSLQEAATEILAEIGRDAEDPGACEGLDFDLPAEAARRVGMCVVAVDGKDYCLLCKPLSDD